MAVFKEDENKKRKLVYLLSGTKPNSNGKNLLAAPAILQIEEIEEKLRFIMMLEFSQIE